MPLMPAFAEINERAKRVVSSARIPTKLLITFGARDSANCTSIALEAINLLDQKPQVKVVMGTNAPYANSIAAMVKNQSWVHIIRESGHMAALYEQCDLAIGAPGVSQFERACCGLTSIIVPQNYRQERLAEEWAKSGAAVHCAADANAIADVFSSLLSSTGEVGRMRKCGLSLVDGRGAQRLAAALKRRLRN